MAKNDLKFTVVDDGDLPPVRAGATAAEVAASPTEVPGHDCWEKAAVAYESDGALDHGFECGVCGEFLQAG